MNMDSLRGKERERRVKKARKEEGNEGQADEAGGQKYGHCAETISFILLKILKHQE